jgi:hypothetical protein
LLRQVGKFNDIKIINIRFEHSRSIAADISVVKAAITTTLMQTN